MPEAFTFTKMPPSLHALLDLQVERYGENTYVTCDGQTVSYRALAKLSRELATRLIAAGVTKGERVMLVMPGSIMYLGLWFALSRVGAIETPVNPAYKGLLLRHLIEISSPCLCLIDDQNIDEFSAAAQGCATGRIMSLSQFLSMGLTCGEEHVSLDMRGRDTAGIIFTSGTTGRSKGVMMSHRQQMSFGQAFAEITSLDETDVTYNFLPFFHIAAKFVALGTMLTGGRMFLRAAFSVSSFWSDVKEHGTTVCQAVGGICHMLHSQPPTTFEANNPMRLIYAVPLPWEFRPDFERRFGLTLVEGYGGTESNLVAYSRPDDQPPRGSCGRPSPYFEIAIQDEEGNCCLPGEAGEICVRPRFPSTTMNGYFGVPEKTVEVTADCWFHTGDRGMIDADGFLFFLDRLKDAIRRRGENISSFEIERILNSHPAVAESAVIPVPAQLGEDEVKAVLVFKPDSSVSEEEIFQFSAANMPYFMVPRYIEVRTELPRTPTMKIKKAELKSECNGEATWDCEKAGLRVTRRGVIAVGSIPGPLIRCSTDSY